MPNESWDRGGTAERVERLLQDAEVLLVTARCGSSAIVFASHRPSGAVSEARPGGEDASPLVDELLDRTSPRRILDAFLADPSAAIEHRTSGHLPLEASWSREAIALDALVSELCELVDEPARERLVAACVGSQAQAGGWRGEEAARRAVIASLVARGGDHGSLLALVSAMREVAGSR